MLMEKKEEWYEALPCTNYMCPSSGPSFVWAFFGPQATVFNDDDRQIITHFLSPNPDEGGTARATWQHSRDTSTVWAMAIASSSDPGFVAPGAMPWLLLQVVGADCGPTGGHRLTETTSMQWVHTSGGLGLQPAVPRLQTLAKGRWCLTPPTTSATKPPGVRRSGSAKGAGTVAPGRGWSGNTRATPAGRSGAVGEVGAW